MDSGSRRARYGDSQAFSRPLSRSRRSDAGTSLQSHEHLPHRTTSGTMGASLHEPTIGEGDPMYGYLYGGTAHLQTPAMPSSSHSYQPAYEQAMSRQHQQHQQQAHLGTSFGSGMVFGLSQHESAIPSYAPSTGYSQPQHSAAVEVLSSQFAASGSFYVASDSPTVSTSGPSQHAAAQFASTPLMPGSSSRGASFSHGYVGGLNSAQQTATQTQAIAETSGRDTANFDQAYERYQLMLKRTFQSVHEGSLREAAQSVLELSDWLLSSAVALSMTPSNESLPSFLSKLTRLY